MDEYPGRIDMAGAPDGRDGNVLREQVRLAMGQIPAMQGTSSIVALAVAAVYWNITSHVHAVVWFLMISGIAAWRYRLYVQFQRESRQYFDGALWGRRYAVSTLVSGVVWGSSAVLLFPAGDRTMQAFLVMVMTTLAATTTVSHSSIKNVPTLWSVPAIAPYSIRYLAEGGMFGYTVGALLPLFLLTLSFYSSKLSRAIAASISLRYENLELVEELRQATRLKDQFVSLVSHDLRGPIAGIKSTADFAPFLRGSEAAEKLEAMASSISQIASALLELLDQLLDVSRLQTGKIVPVNRTFVVRLLVDERMSMLAAAAGQKKITLLNQLPEDVRLVADRALYGQVIGNLLSNAVKFSHFGGVVRIYAAEKKGAVVVEDGGIGIDPDILPDIFRHEVKTTMVGTSGERGTGLGLPFCMDIMKAHGGSIEAHSQPDRGSKFIIHVPQASRTVLVVDDVAAHRALFKRALEKVGDVSVTEAENGREAMEELRRTAADLIITDLEMPEMNGVALLSAVRGDLHLKGIPVIAVTSNAGEDLQARQKLRNDLLDAGANELLAKPVIEEELIQCVRRLL